MIVVKFGGTSVGSAPSIKQVTEIVRSRLDRKPVVVVSALSKVTDLLYRIVAQGPELQDNLKALKERHFSLIRELLNADLRQSIATQKEVQAIIDRVAEISAKAELSERDKAAIISTGELMSSHIVCAALNQAGVRTQWVDVRRMMIASGDPLKSEPDMDELCERAPEVIAEAFGNGAQAVITQGFICASGSGKSAILGRGGSDYSASLIGMAIDAAAVEIWTDVDGVRTADPRRVPTTHCIEQLSYEQASEMAHFGAKVLHPLTLEPAQKKNIPVYVLNTHNPQGGSTVVLPQEMVGAEVKSVSFKEQILVVTMSSRQPMDSTGFLKKVFDVLGECKISVDLISTSNSQISVTLDAAQKRIPLAVEKLESFANVFVDEGKAQISAIGSSTSCLNSILSRNFAPLRDCRIYMISPGASVVNISFVVDRSSLDQTLCQTHKFLIENESSN